MTTPTTTIPIGTINNCTTDITHILNICRSIYDRSEGDIDSELVEIFRLATRARLMLEVFEPPFEVTDQTPSQEEPAKPRKPR